MEMEQTVRILALVIGIIGIVLGVAMTVVARSAGEPRRSAAGFFVWPNMLSAILVILGIIGIAVGKAASGAWLGVIIAALVIGWVLVFGVFQVSRIASRKLASDAPSASPTASARVGFNLLSASGVLSCAAALIGVTIILASMPSTPSENGLAIPVLLALALGFWAAATFWGYSSSLYRNVLAQETEIQPADMGSLCVRFRSASGEMAFLIAVALVAAVCLGVYHYKGDLPGIVYPLGIFAVSLLFGIVTMPLLSPGSGRSQAKYALGILIFLAGSALGAYYLADRMLGEISAFYAFGIGLATAMLLMLTARYRPPFVGIGTPFGTEIAIAQGLMLVASELLAFRWLGGYGVALCTLGLFSAFGILFSMGALWAIRRAGDDSSEISDLPFMSHAASRFAEIIMAGGSFLLLVTLIRLFYEEAALTSAGIDIMAPYPLIGLVLGASFPILLRSLAVAEHTGRRAGSFDRADLTRLGMWAAFRTLGIWLIAGITPLLVAFFWRIEGIGAFMVGLAAAEFFLVLTLWLGEVRNCADDAVRFANRATHVLVVGTGLLAILFGPLLVTATDQFTRRQKIDTLVGVLVLVLVWTLIVAWRRGRRQR